MSPKVPKNLQFWPGFDRTSVLPKQKFDPSSSRHFYGPSFPVPRIWPTQSCSPESHDCYVESYEGGIRRDFQSIDPTPAEFSKPVAWLFELSLKSVLTSLLPKQQRCFQPRHYLSYHYLDSRYMYFFNRDRNHAKVSSRISLITDNPDIKSSISQRLISPLIVHSPFLHLLLHLESHLKSYRHRLQ